MKYLFALIRHERYSPAGEQDVRDPFAKALFLNDIFSQAGNKRQQIVLFRFRHVELVERFDQVFAMDSPPLGVKCL